ncbi:MAG: enoyl-CoA hydratase/isomerase family protein [Promethearchaeota archaeon]
MADYETVKFDIEGHFLADTEMIGVVTLNRAAKLNAINPQLVEDLGKVFDEIEKNKDVRVVIIRSASEKAFSVGADVAAAASMMSELDKAREFVATGQKLFRRIASFPKPIVAELNGFVLGGGLELAMCCDLRIVEKGAKLGNPEVQLGLVAAWGGTQRMAKIVGIGKAKELILSGRQATADEALACGLVNKVVEPDELHSEALFMAQQIADNAPIAVRYSKRLINMSFDVPIEKGNAEELDAICSTFTTKDLQAGITALFSKSKPKFTDE